MSGYSFSALQSRRGAGLGNEVIGWGKAYIGSYVLGLQVLSPPWVINPRGYRRELDWRLSNDLKYALARLLPHDTLTDSDYLSSGVVDYEDYLRLRLAEGSLTRGRSVLHESGMQGGYLSISAAQPYLRAMLVSSRSGVAAAAAVRALPRDGVRVGVHYRSGDFDAQPPAPGEFNRALPIQWYLDVVSSLASSGLGSVHVVVASDSHETHLDDALARIAASVRRVGSNSIGDIAALAECDLLVSSVSSFSMLVAFLSDAPYVWYGNQLSSHQGLRGIWAVETVGVGGTQAAVMHEKIVQDPPSVERGIALGDRIEWPRWLAPYLDVKRATRRRESDLIYYGLVATGGD